MKAPSHLQTLAESQAGAAPKPTKLDALQRKDASRNLNETKLRAWRKAVDARDAKNGFVCRWSGKKLARTTTQQPDRAERHHIEPRINKKTRYDVRNGLLVSLESHQRFQQHELKIIEGQAFEIDGRAYWDANGPLKVMDVEAGVSRWI
jgi:hypothetical protein